MAGGPSAPRRHGEFSQALLSGYDFRGLARSVDIMEPEGYGRIDDTQRAREGRFTIDYARCMAPGRPVMWSRPACPC